MSKAFIWLIFQTSLLLNACRSSSNSRPMGAEKVMPAAGMSYDQLTLKVSTHSCLKDMGAPQIANTPYENFSADLVTNFDRVLNEFDLNSAIAFSLGIISGDARAEFAQQIINTTTSVTLLVTSKVITHTESSSQVEVDSALNSLSQPVFQQQCGDSFIDTVTYGGRLHTYISFNFASENTTNRFATHIRARIFGIKALDSFKETLTAEEIKSATVKIGYLQQGGLPTTINTTTCTLSDYESCRKLVDKVFQIATVDFPKSVNADNAHWLQFQSRIYPGRILNTDVKALRNRDQTALQVARTIVKQKNLENLVNHREDYNDSIATEVVSANADALDDLTTLKQNIQKCSRHNSGTSECRDPKDLPLKSTVAQSDPLFNKTAYALSPLWAFGDGSQGGDSFQHICRNHIIGLNIGRNASGAIQELTPQCNDSPSTVLDDNSASCPRGQLVYALRGNNSTTGIAYAAIACGLTPPSPAANLTLRNIFGTQAPATALQTCPPDHAAGGIYGKVGANGGIVQLGLICRHL